MASSKAITRLLQQLLKRSYRQDKAIDKYQFKFLKKLQSTETVEDENQLFDEYSQQLESTPYTLEDKLSEGKLVARQSQAQLQQINSLSEAVKDKIAEMQDAPEPYTITEHHCALKDLVKIYQHAVIELNKSCTPSEVDTKADISFINDELQLLILELDVGQAFAKKLEKVRIDISNDPDPFQLPQYCLQVINIIIDSTREERRTSRHFLYTLNDSLTQFYLNFAQTLKLSEEDFEKQKETYKTIHQGADQLQANSKNQTLEELQASISDYVTNVKAAMALQEEQQEEKYRTKFQSMVRQIKELQNETQSYQKTLKQQNKQLHIDFLTKIPNRAAWSERLKTEVTRYQRYKTPLNLAIIDIDNFKSINDRFGHLAGDKVLNVIAQTLQKSIRNADYIARFGGEEFTLLLPEISPTQTELALNKLRDRIKSIPFQFKQEHLTITISVGFTAFTPSDESDDVFERADTALYQAKRQGRDQVFQLTKNEQKSENQ
ncbi:GGDEF domain-containing protein [Psychromonas sp. 14N.309.X.WAT.B.A12]|uniref:GGDEF domain-containing protein n=1 Tax=Psychromonas sp. 14N.309.X.WAT.B.A12 TaxID=2998322 RepID=UPI0025AFCF40|nr:GGDEF domain-containing protein [Psychromonas sp. 14N.309.X.WAT.B.A12]MDN2663003.1 GGDEF domain-containing protein [Psychromonas sp. 14N.309.X.WAT.B.A12]